MPPLHQSYQRIFLKKVKNLPQDWRKPVELDREAHLKIIRREGPGLVPCQVIINYRVWEEFRERLDVLTDPRHIISLMREITEFISRYRAIVNENYLDYYNEIIIGAEQKISNA